MRLLRLYQQSKLFFALPDRLETTIGSGRRGSTWKRVDYIFDSGKHSSMGCQHAGKITGLGSPPARRILRGMGMDNNHPRLGATGHFLQISFRYLPIRGVEELLQVQTTRNTTNPELIISRYHYFSKFTVSLIFMPTKKISKTIILLSCICNLSTINNVAIIFTYFHLVFLILHTPNVLQCSLIFTNLKTEVGKVSRFFQIRIRGGVIASGKCGRVSLDPKSTR